MGVAYIQKDGATLLVEKQQNKLIERKAFVRVQIFLEGAFYQVNCKERTTCTNSSEVKPDLCEDQDQQCSVKYKSK